MALSEVGSAADMTVLEFCIGMALARRGSLTAREIAGEVSTWLDKPVRCRMLNGQLKTIAARGSARLEAGTYTLSEAGTEALCGFYSAFVRMLDGGRRLLDVAVFMSRIKKFTEEDHDPPPMHCLACCFQPGPCRNRPAARVER